MRWGRFLQNNDIHSLLGIGNLTMFFLEIEEYVTVYVRHEYWWYFLLFKQFVYLIIFTEINMATEGEDINDYKYCDQMTNMTVIGYMQHYQTF